ncbi:MAG: type II toxin-antitoxin system VapC family toxin [Deltaproteobacteria bacterium]|nr:type II toxin-antitoxin system VapC family toxin [Deltaproteobacteria bacterium]
MKIALDTNTYTDAARADAKAMEVLRSADEIYLPFVVIAELRSGFSLGSKGKKNEAKLTEFLNTPRVKVLCPDEQTTHHYARVYSHLKKQGTPIPTHDIWIAAMTLQYDLVLFSRDAHFSQVPQIVKI